MIAYAGIGTRDITVNDMNTICIVAKYLSEKDVVLYSGNADGSDICFQSNSNGKCVIYLPWCGFNKTNYDLKSSIEFIVCGDTKWGLDSIDKYHPNPKALSRGARALMCRNYHQIFGYDLPPIIRHPKVSFVVCCASRDNKGNEIGGTGQACRIAKDNGIPVLNLRYDYDFKTIYGVLDNLIKENKI